MKLLAYFCKLDDDDEQMSFEKRHWFIFQECVESSLHLHDDFAKFAPSACNYIYC